ncbi:hypothetical protein ACOMHN_009176 [Nucella lapillus]
MGGRGDQMEGGVLLLFALLHFPLPCPSLVITPGEIVFGNKTRQLEFAVASDVTIRCRVHKPAQHDVTKMTLNETATKEPFDVLVVGDDAIETTLYNVTQGQMEFVCLEGSTLLARRTLCVGYGPSGEMRVSCRLYPESSLDCCVRTDQSQDTLCNVVWTMHYRQLQRNGTWEPLPDTIREGQFDVSQCVSWLFKGNNRPQYYSDISVRAKAANQIGTAHVDHIFTPSDYVVPGPVDSLRVHSYVRDPTSLLVTWYHSPGLGSTVCQAMGGLSYRINLTSSLYRKRPRTFEADCSISNFSEEQRYVVTGLIPYTAYRVTLTPLSPRFHGNNRSAENTTSQSRPLKAPTIVGWSANTSPDRVVVYWKTVSHRYRGGPIIAHSITVDSKKSGREDYHFNVRDDVVRAERQVVTSPQALEGCSAECVVTVTSSTVVGASAPASVRISSRPKDLKFPVVYTEKAESGNRTVSWEGSVNVISVAWCYGTSFDGDNSLIHCKTEVEERDVETPAVHHLVLPASLLATPHYPPLQCDNCRWHFAVRVPAHTPHHPDTDTADDTGHDTDTVHDTGHDTDTADDTGHDTATATATATDVNGENDDSSEEAELDNFAESSSAEEDRAYETGRLVWNRCEYALDGVAPVPEVQIPEAVSSDGVEVTVQFLCSSSHEGVGKPIQAQLAYELSPQNCSDAKDWETRYISLGVYENGAVGFQLSLSGLRRGSDYTLCVRLRSRRGWGQWRLKRFSLKTADDMRYVIVSLICGVVLVIMGCSIYQCWSSLKAMSRRFTRLHDFRHWIESEPVLNDNDSSVQPPCIPMREQNVLNSASRPQLDLCLLPVQHVPNNLSNGRLCEEDQQANPSFRKAAERSLLSDFQEPSLTEKSKEQGSAGTFPWTTTSSVASVSCPRLVLVIMATAE